MELSQSETDASGQIGNLANGSTVGEGMQPHDRCSIVILFGLDHAKLVHCIVVPNGDGKFTPIEGNLHYADGLRKIDWPSENQASYNLQSLHSPYKIGPINFGGEYWTGFLQGTFHWQQVLEDPEGSSSQTIATVRELRASDKALLAD